MTEITGATVLVTGANGGLGTEFVAQALARGARRVYAAARRPHAWEDERVTTLTLDVTDPASVEAAATVADDVTVLINNAGILRRGDLLTSPVDAIRDQIETNLFGPLLMTRAFASTLIRHQGALVNVASVLSWLALGKGYSISKAALWSATNGLRLELAPQGVQVLGAYLATTDTPMNRTAGLSAENDPRDVVRAILDGLERGDDEVLADETTRSVRAALAHPVAALHRPRRSA